MLVVVVVVVVVLVLVLVVLAPAALPGTGAMRPLGGAAGSPMLVVLGAAPVVLAPGVVGWLGSTGR